MQPQAPSSPDPNYDFIMNSANKPKKSWLPDLGLPRPVLLGLIGAIVLIIVILIYAAISGGNKGNSTSVIGLMGRAQEIARASDLAAQDSQDSNLDALASTVSTVLSSQEAQLGNYVAEAGQKVDPKSLSVYQNSATDSTFQTAAQNNNLPTTYNNYLTAVLNSYEINLNNEYKKASSPQLRSILLDSYNSVQTILSSPSLKN